MFCLPSACRPAVAPASQWGLSRAAGAAECRNHRRETHRNRADAIVLAARQHRGMVHHRCRCTRCAIACACLASHRYRSEGVTERHTWPCVRICWGIGPRVSRCRVSHMEWSLVGCGASSLSFINYCNMRKNRRLRAVSMFGSMYPFGLLHACIPFAIIEERRLHRAWPALAPIRICWNCGNATL